MKIRIPKTFQIGSRTIRVVWKKKLIAQEGAYGRAIYGNDTLELQESSPDNLLTQNTMSTTYLHELLHFIFDIMAEDKLKNDEKLIDVMSEFLNQALTSSKY